MHALSHDTIWSGTRPIEMTQEDFDTDSLATFLHLTPTQIERMAGRGKLPGRKIGGNWKFSRAEINHWFEEKIGVSGESELIEVEKVLDTDKSEAFEERIDLSQLMPEQAFFVPIQARTKRSLIQTHCDHCCEIGFLWDPEKMAEAIHAREEMHTTALESGVALLHPRRPMPNILGEPFVSLAVTSNGIPFGGPRGSLTDIFFLIGSTNDRIHLLILTRLSRLITHSEWLDSIRNSDSAEQARQSILSADAEMS